MNTYFNQEPLGLGLFAFNEAEIAGKGHIGFFQVKLEFPGANNSIRIPLSFTCSNRTELIKESQVGQIGRDPQPRRNVCRQSLSWGRELVDPRFAPRSDDPVIRRRRCGVRPDPRSVRRSTESTASRDRARQRQVIERDGAKVAAYRDKSGHVTLRSATCTHMGCIVA